MITLHGDEPVSHDVVVRRERYFERGIIGTVHFSWLADVPDYYTLELPWLDNERNISCIPAGEYKMRMRAGTSRHNYPHLLIERVPSRSAILFHRGNYPADTRGCLLVGSDASTVKPVIFQSRHALRLMMDSVGLTMAATGRTKLNLLIEG